MKRYMPLMAVLVLVALGVTSFMLTRLGHAQTQIQQELAAQAELKDFWARQTLPGVKPGVVYDEIINTGDIDLTFKAVTSGVANRIEIHDHINDNGIMRMRKVDELVIKAHESLVLKPGGKHIMLYERTSELLPGENHDFTLFFDHDVTITTTAPVFAVGKKPVFE